MTETERAELRAEYTALRRWLWGILAAVIVGGLGALVQGGAALERLDATARLATENASRIATVERREAVRDATSARLEDPCGSRKTGRLTRGHHWLVRPAFRHF